MACEAHHIDDLAFVVTFCAIFRHCWFIFISVQNSSESLEELYAKCIGDAEAFMKGESGVDGDFLALEQEVFLKAYYFVPKELPTKSYPKITQNVANNAGERGARSAPPHC